ncbi:MAG: carbohydrate-binding domain-containing protein [Oscillospiraceae bacterium]|jgi:hypothetical protein|nr:carbohydrate-binding domain-containing protein [Oscillospiraceae bacterium]
MPLPKNLKRSGAFTLALLFSVVFAGCAATNAKNGDAPPAGATKTISEQVAAGSAAALSGSVTEITLGKAVQIKGDGAEARGSEILITQTGNYRLSGSYDGRVRIEAGKGAVHLELVNAEITSPAGAAIYAANADQLDIVLAENTANTLTAAIAAVGEEEEKAALFSEVPLLLRGNGKLIITEAFRHGIASDDTMIVQGGVYDITAATDGLHTNDEMIIQNGSFTLACGSDGMGSEKNLDIKDGLIKITKCEEGLESKEALTVSGGSIEITSTDDGLNAGTAITVNGGAVLVHAEGDGLDSNGDITLNGGVLRVYSTGRGGEGALDIGDRTGSLRINGGDLVAVGMGLLATPSAKSKQPYAAVGGTFAPGNQFRLKAGGTVAAETEIQGTGTMVLLSTPKLAEGKTYEAFLDDVSLGSGTVTGGALTIGSVTTGMGGMGGERPLPEGFSRLDRGLPPEDFTFPEGRKPEEFTAPAGGTGGAA